MKERLGLAQEVGSDLGALFGHENPVKKVRPEAPPCESSLSSVMFPMNLIARFEAETCR